MGLSIADALGKKKHRVPGPHSELVIPDAKIGVEIECENVRSVDGMIDVWSVKTDGSLRNNGHEFVTNGGMVGSQLVEAIEWFCPWAKKMKYQDGVPRAGIHIHMDVTDMNERHANELRFLMEAYIISEHLIFGFAEHGYEPGLRWGSGYCDAWNYAKADHANLSKLVCRWGQLSKEEIAELLRGGDDGRYFSKYQAVNLLPIARFGTVEFRHLPTTFDKARIFAWINILLSLKKFAQEQPENFDILNYFSLNGAEGLYRAIFGTKLYNDHLRRHFDQLKAWEGVENAQTISRLHANEPRNLYFDGVTSPSVLEKIKLLPKQTKAAKIPELDVAAPRAAPRARQARFIDGGPVPPQAEPALPEWLRMEANAPEPLPPRVAAVHELQQAATRAWNMNNPGFSMDARQAWGDLFRNYMRDRPWITVAAVTQFQNANPHLRPW